MDASPAAIELFRRDTMRWRATIKSLLQNHADNLSDEFLDFSDRVLSFDWLEELYYRQAEWLVDVHNQNLRVEIYKGFKVQYLLQKVYEARLDLYESQEEYICLLHAKAEKFIRIEDAKRVLRLARALDLID